MSVSKTPSSVNPRGKNPDITDGGKNTAFNKGGKVNLLAPGSNEIGIPHGQSPGLGRGDKYVSDNQLPSTASVVKSASSNLMTGMSQSRGAEKARK